MWRTCVRVIPPPYLPTNKVKKKLHDIKVDAKKRLASHRKSVCAMGGGTGQPELIPLDEKLAGSLGESLLSGVVTEVDTDAGPQGAEDPGM